MNDDKSFTVLKTEDLCGDLLNWAVCRAKYPKASMSKNHVWLPSSGGEDGFLIEDYSSNWVECGKIIEKHGIHLYRTHHATTTSNGETKMKKVWIANQRKGKNARMGDTPLIAVMRCYVKSKLGDTINIPFYDEKGLL